MVHAHNMLMTSMNRMAITMMIIAPHLSLMVSGRNQLWGYFKENDWTKGKKNSWEMSEVSVIDSDGADWGGWGNGGDQDKGKEMVENGSDPWGSQLANTSKDCLVQFRAAKQKHTSQSS
jgi:hypothetical protein